MDGRLHATQFTTTHWSAVLEAGKRDWPAASAALEELCRTYWYPLYAFVRRQGHSPEDAEDLTQGFFERLLEKGYVKLADPSRGKFRSFLLSSLKNFVANQSERSTQEKRGGGRALLRWDQASAEGRYQMEPVDELTPEKIFEKQWAMTLLEQALSRLKQEQAAAADDPLERGARGRQRRFDGDYHLSESLDLVKCKLLPIRTQSPTKKGAGSLLLPVKVGISC